MRMPRYGTLMVGNASVANVNRAALIREYGLLRKQMQRLRMRPLVSVDVLDLMSDDDLAALILDCVRRIIDLRRAEREL